MAHRIRKAGKIQDLPLANRRPSENTDSLDTQEELMFPLESGSKKKTDASAPKRSGRKSSLFCWWISLLFSPGLQLTR